MMGYNFGGMGLAMLWPLIAILAIFMFFLFWMTERPLRGSGNGSQRAPSEPQPQRVSSIPNSQQRRQRHGAGRTHQRNQ